MSKTPISSPKLEPHSPTTPTSGSIRKPRSLVSTPDVTSVVPNTPSLKRNSRNLGHIESPYGLLKTPRHQDSDDEDNGTMVTPGSKRNSRYKFPKTPNYFLPGKKLFDEEKITTKDKEKEDINNISLQLKGKLINAFEKISQKDRKKFEFTELTFSTSPTKRSPDKSPNKSPLTAPLFHQSQNQNLNQPLHHHPSSMAPKDHALDDGLKRANLNLQNMTNNDYNYHHHHTSILNKSIDLQTSPVFKEEREINIPMEDSAHNALIATLNRQQHLPTTSKSPVNIANTTTTADVSRIRDINLPDVKDDKKFHLPPITVKEKKNTEQDAVYSLMSLSSPQAVKFQHSRTHSLTSTSAPASAGYASTGLGINGGNSQHEPSVTHSRSSSVTLPPVSPNKNMVNLPPISGLIKNDDETDIESDTDNDNDE